MTQEFHQPPPPVQGTEVSSVDDTSTTRTPEVSPDEMAGSVEAVLAYVGDDPKLAAAALHFEARNKNRSTLISKLQALTRQDA